MTEDLAGAYRPSHDELARQQFVGALKQYVNGPLEQAIAADYAARIQPEHRQRSGRDPVNRHDVAEAFSQSRLFQLWGAAVYESQDMMWRTVDETVQRVLPDFAAAYAKLGATRLGSLELDPSLVLPEPIRDVEIHRQPGGYFAEADGSDLLTALRYFGTVELYRNAKGMDPGNRAGEPGIGSFIVGQVKKRYPEIAPARIVDLGCGPGIDTIAYARAFPEADLWGIDLSPPFLRFAHLWAETQGHSIHYRQANAAATGLEEASVDLIVSNILFHETSDEVLRGIVRETRRILAPGGVMLNFDVAYQPDRISVPRQVTNAWQVVNNGEPYWTGFAELDLRAELLEAGFPAESIRYEYEPLGSNELLVFGAEVPA